MTNIVVTKIKLQGLHCPSCQKIVEKRLKGLEGVEGVNVNLDSGAVHITGDRLFDKDDIMKVLKGTGYELKL